MYKIFSVGAVVLMFVAACTSLTFSEQQELADLQYRGITVDRAPGGWQAPANPGTAGALNLFPGFGNFYLASGNAGDSSHWLYGLLNLLTWPISILWGIPEASIDAATINKRDMLNFYKYGDGTRTQFRNPAVNTYNNSRVYQDYQPQQYQQQYQPQYQQQYQPQYQQQYQRYQYQQYQQYQPQRGYRGN